MSWVLSSRSLVIGSVEVRPVIGALRAVSYWLVRLISFIDRLWDFFELFIRLRWLIFAVNSVWNFDDFERERLFTSVYFTNVHLGLIRLPLTDCSTSLLCIKPSLSCLHQRSLSVFLSALVILNVFPLMTVNRVTGHFVLLRAWFLDDTIGIVSLSHP